MGPVLEDDTGLNHTEDEGGRMANGDEFSHGQSERAAARDPTEQLEVDDLGCGYNGGKPEEPEEPNQGVHGLCFSSRGDFVGFSGPVSGCASGDVLRKNSALPDLCTQGQEGPEAAPRLLPPGAANGEMFEVHLDDFRAKTGAAACPDDVGGHEQTNGLSSTHSSYLENDKMAEIRLPIESPKRLIYVGDSPNCTENGAYPHLALESPPCSSTPVSALKEFD